MADSFSLGNNGKFGNLDFAKLKSGVTKKDLGIEGNSLLSTIFDQINTNKEDGKEEKLDRTEIEVLKQIIMSLARGNNKLTSAEARKFKLGGENIGKEKDALLEFLAKLSDLTQGVEKVEQKADTKSEIITYDDGRTEEVFQDGSKILTVTNGNKTTKTKYDKDGNITEETVTDGDEKETVTEFVGGKKSKVTVNDKANKTVTTTQFNGDKKTKETVESESETIVVEYDEAEQPKTKTVTNKETNIVETFSQENGNLVLKKVFNPDGNTTVTYDGKITKMVSEEDNVKTTLIAETLDNGETITRSRKVQTILSNGKTQLVETTYNGEDFTEETSLDGLPTSQRKVVDGQEYKVDYVPVDKEISEDGVGVRVIVQNGESIAMLAKRFGCSVADIIKLNGSVVKGKHPNAYFLVGQEITIPGKLEADHPELINRKSASEANADYESFIRRRDAERARREEEARAAEAEKAAKEIKQGEDKMALQSAAKIVEELLAETKGVNNKKNIRAILSRIDNPTELAEVNRLLAAQGYEADDLYSSIEKFINKELQRVETDFTCEDLEAFVQRMIDNKIIQGQEAIDAQARMAARVIFDAGDGFGTDCDETKRGIYLIKAPNGNDPAAAKAVYDKVNDIVKKHRTFYGLGKPCDDLKDYLQGELWTKEIEYLEGILAENNAIQGEQKENAISTLFMRAVKGAGTDIEKLTQAIKAITSEEDRAALEEELVKYCEEKGIKARISGQSTLQAVLYDECDKNMGVSRDYDEIRKFNDMLIKQGAYSEQDAVKVKAEQVAIQMLEGDYNNILDAVKHVDDKAVLAKVDELLKTKGYKGLNDYLSQKLNSEKANLVKAELAGKNLLSNAEAVNVAVALLQKTDFDTRAKGLMAIRNEEVAKAVDAELQKKGISLAEIVEQFNKEKSNYKLAAKVFDFLGAEKFSDDLRANTDVSDNLYVEASNPQQVSEEQKAAYDAVISALEKDYKEAMEAYQKARDDQGGFSWFVNNVADRLNLGTTRDEIEASLEHNKETLRLLKLAADGKLAKMENGKTVSVSFEAVFNERTNVTFDTAKTQKVADQGMRMAMMNQIKDFVAVCWRDLESGQNSNDVKQLSLGIYNAVKNTGKDISEYGFKLSTDGVLVKPDGTVATAGELQTLAKQIKEALAAYANVVLGENVVSADADSATVTKAMDKAYEKNIKAFKEEYEAAFGTKPTDAMVESYLKTINTGKMVGTIALSIGAVVAAPFTGGTSLAAVAGLSATTATAIVAGLNTAVVTMGLNALENSTDADGYTNSELTADLENAIMTGITAAIGVKVGAIADDIAANAGKIVKHLKAYGFEVSADAVTSFAETYIQHGEFNTQEFVKAMAISLVANGVGRYVSSKGAKGSDDAVSDTPVLDKASEQGKANASSVKVGDKKAADIAQEIDDVASNPNAKPDDLAKVRDEAGALQNRELRRQSQQKLDDAADSRGLGFNQKYQDSVETSLGKRVKAIFEKKSITPADLRIVKEYAKMADNVDELNAILAKIESYHYVDSMQEQVKQLRKTINKRIKDINSGKVTPAPKSADGAKPADNTKPVETKPVDEVKPADGSNGVKGAKNADGVAETVSVAAQSEGVTLPKDGSAIFKGTENLVLGNYELDLSSPKIRKQLASLKEGQSLTVGRNGDIEVGNGFDVSRKHITITKKGDGFVITNNSRRGVRVGQSKAHISDEIKETFGFQSNKMASELKEGEGFFLAKGDTIYKIENVNGKISITGREVRQNFSSNIPFDDIPMSNRTPAGKNYPGKKMGEILSDAQKKVYVDSDVAFKRSKGKRIVHKASSAINENHMLHGTNLEALLSPDGILAEGLRPREISGRSAAVQDGRIVDTLTPLCLDVWDVRTNTDIRGYFDPSHPHWEAGRSGDAGEFNFLPDRSRRQASVVVVLNKNAIDPTIMKNSFEVNGNGKSVLFDNGVMSRGHNYPTHRGIPMGAPANSIEKLIIDTRSVSRGEIEQIKHAIRENGLYISLFDLNGNQL